MHPSRCRSRSVGSAQGAGDPARGWQSAPRRGSARDRSRLPRPSCACPVLRWAVGGSSVGIVKQLTPLPACLYAPPCRQRIVSECTASAQQFVPRMSASGFVRLSTALSPQPADRLSPRRSRSLQAVQSAVLIRWRCTGWWGSGPRLAACVPAKVLLRQATSSLSSPAQDMVVVVVPSPLSQQVRSPPPCMRSPFQCLALPFSDVPVVLAGFFIKTMQNTWDILKKGGG